MIFPNLMKTSKNQIISPYPDTLSGDYTLISIAHQGIGIEYFDKLLERTGISKGLLASLIGVDPRTVDNYRKNNRNFDVLEGELLLKLFRLFDYGEDVFEDMNDFILWLQLKSRGLSNKKPIEFLNTSTGVDLVYDELKRIEYGDII